MLTVKQIFDLGIKIGIASDPRGVQGIKKYLARQKKEYDDLKPKDKGFFDRETLTNPFPDSGIHVDDGKSNVKMVMAGIDINAPEILLASQLNERGKKIGLVIAHHPEGKALGKLHEVMEMGVDIGMALGLPVHLAEKIMEERMREVARSLSAANLYQAVNVAEHLGINFINAHTITDNLVHTFIANLIAKRQPETIADLMDLLMEIPEYQMAKRLGFGPVIFAGTPRNRVGKIMIEMTGGTEPSPKVYPELSRIGISTIVGMHMRKETLEKSNEAQLNVVVAGHMSSDSLGMNLFLDELEKKGIEIVPCGGLIRVSRVKKGKK
ncbi:MAG: NGG1p interacting factor NIF3 [Candidatus Magasanikbacteria bacterium]|nr:NGG1p interacting factor NIF3 [Candidatus Magasanikbacteria bacterium]